MLFDIETEQERKLWCKAWRMLQKFQSKAEQELASEFSQLHTQEQLAQKKDFETIRMAIRSLRE